MELNNEDFGTLAVCSIRYCRDRQTYMPSLVIDIIRPHLSELSDKDLQVLINDCGDKCRSPFSDGSIDSVGWNHWKATLLNEQERRRINE